MLFVFFTAVYFIVFFFIIQWIFRNTLSGWTDLLAVVCCIIALVVSVGLAEYTVKKIKQKKSN